MKIKIAKIDSSAMDKITKPLQVDVNVEVIKNNKRKIQSYIADAREHLMSLKKELYKTLDVGIENAWSYSLRDIPDVNYDDKLSDFLEKAYAGQEFDKEGKALENRFQSYINAGIDFTKFCEEGGDEITPDHIFLNDAGKLVGAINSAISQLNRAETQLKKAEKVEAEAAESDKHITQVEVDKEYENVGLIARQFGTMVDTVLEGAQNSKIMEVIPNQISWKQICSSIVDAFKSLGNYFSNLGKSQAEVEESQTGKYRQEYKLIREQFNPPEPKPEPGQEDSSNIESDFMS